MEQPRYRRLLEQKEPHEVAAAWADAEVELLRLGLRTHGNNWAKISPSLPEKTPAQCKEYFYSMRKKLQLDKIVQEYKKVGIAQESSQDVRALICVVLYTVPLTLGEW